MLETFEQTAQDLSQSIQTSYQTAHGQQEIISQAEGLSQTSADQKVEQNAPLSSRAFAFITNARVLNQNGEYELALNLLRQACNLQSHELIFKEMTKTLILKKAWNEAQKISSKLHEMYPSFDSSFLKAQVEYELGQDDKSLQSYFECMSYVATEVPQLFDIFKNVGNIYVRKGDFESAEEFYNKAYSFNNHSDILYVNYGILEMQRGDLNRAKDRFRTALHINSMNDKAWTSLAMVHFEFGDEDLGAANIKKALDINPQNKTAISFSFQKMNQKKHGEFLIEVMQAFLDKAEFDEEVSCMLIQKLYEMGRIQLAILECNRLLLWNPLKEEYFNLLAQLERESA